MSMWTLGSDGIWRATYNGFELAVWKGGKARPEQHYYQVAKGGTTYAEDCEDVNDGQSKAVARVDSGVW